MRTGRSRWRSRALLAVFALTPVPATPVAQAEGPDAVVWLERAADEARTITGRGPALTGALRDKGRLLARVAGLGAAMEDRHADPAGAGDPTDVPDAQGDADSSERWFTLAELCERALSHRNANGPVTTELISALIYADRIDEARSRIDALDPGPAGEPDRAALARALAAQAPSDANAADLRSGADPAAAATWAAAFIEADDFGGLENLAADADLSDRGYATLLASLAEAHARIGADAEARRSLDRALILAANDPTPDDDLALALVGAYAALGEIDPAAAASPDPAEPRRTDPRPLPAGRRPGRGRR